MTLESKDVVFWLIFTLIVIAPLEMVIGIEIIIYPISIIVLLLCILIEKKIYIRENAYLIFYLLYALLTCFWSKNNNAIASSFSTIIMYFLLFLLLQFEYTEYEFDKFQKAIIIQGIVVLILCFLFGEYQDERFWILSRTTGADPNYLSGWFILPICICVKYFFQQYISIPIKFALMIEVFLALYFVMQSGSRSGVICNLGAMLFSLYYELRNIIKKNPIIGGIGILASIILVVAICLMLPETMLYRFRMADSNLGGRGAIWEELWRILNNNVAGFLFGMGQGSVTLYTTHRIVAHNTFLDILFETGIIGLAFYCVFCFLALRNAIAKSWIIGIALIANYILIFTLSSIYMRPLILMFFVAACNVCEGDVAFYGKKAST